MLGCLMYQTRPPDETLVYASEVPLGELLRLKEDFPHVLFRAEPNRDDWGHEKRALGLAHATGDVIGWFADDDDYSQHYIGVLLSAIRYGADVAYCDWSGAPQGCDFRLGSSTSGNFLIRTALAREVGWTSRRYEADGDFIDGVAATEGVQIQRIANVLYTHNAHA